MVWVTPWQHREFNLGIVGPLVRKSNFEHGRGFLSISIYLAVLPSTFFDSIQHLSITGATIVLHTCSASFWIFALITVVCKQMEAQIPPYTTLKACSLPPWQQPSQHSLTLSMLQTTTATNTVLTSMTGSCKQTPAQIQSCMLMSISCIATSVLLF